MKKFTTKFLVAAAAALGAAQTASAQYTDFNSMMTQANTTMASAAGVIINFASILIGLVGIVMLIWNFIKRSKNDASSNDALLGWAIGLLFAALGLQVVRIVFLGGAI